MDGFGLLDYHARYYDATLGRFISPDGVVPDYANPQDLNRYSYVRGNPVRFTDPSGHYVDSAGDIGGIKESDLAMAAVIIGGYIGGQVLQKAAGDISFEPRYRDGWVEGFTVGVPVDAGTYIEGPVLGDVPPSIFVTPLGEEQDISTSDFPLNSQLELPTYVTSSRELAKNMEAAGISRPPDSAAHHIVAENDPRAAVSRAILAAEGLDVNSAANGVYLPKNLSVPNPSGATVHSTVHTNKYYQQVEQDLLNTAPGTIHQTLGAIRRGLLQNDYPY